MSVSPATRIQSIVIILRHTVFLLTKMKGARFFLLNVQFKLFNIFMRERSSVGFKWLKVSQIEIGWEPLGWETWRHWVHNELRSLNLTCANFHLLLSSRKRARSHFSEHKILFSSKTKQQDSSLSQDKISFFSTASTFKRQSKN